MSIRILLSAIIGSGGGALIGFAAYNATNSLWSISFSAPLAFAWGYLIQKIIMDA